MVVMPAAISFPTGMACVTLVRRVNRFAVSARAADGRRLYLHLPNSGRMEELLRPGARGLAHLGVAGTARRTVGTLLLVRHKRRWVGLDARMPNRLFEAALRAEALPPFRGYRRWRREVRFGAGRIDFVLEGRGRTLLVETKSCNRVDGGIALFPDAPTARGARHLLELARALEPGRRAAVVWIVQRDDARVLRPFAEADPRFADAVRTAAAGGVALLAYTCRVTARRMVLLRRIPVEVG